MGGRGARHAANQEAQMSRPLPATAPQCEDSPPPRNPRERARHRQPPRPAVKAPNGQSAPTTPALGGGGGDGDDDGGWRREAEERGRPGKPRVGKPV